VKFHAEDPRFTAKVALLSFHINFTIIKSMIKGRDERMDGMTIREEAVTNTNA
jgi:hypothetical protein